MYFVITHPKLRGVSRRHCTDLWLDQLDMLCCDWTPSRTANHRVALCWVGVVEQWDLCGDWCSSVWTVFVQLSTTADCQYSLSAVDRGVATRGQQAGSPVPSTIKPQASWLWAQTQTSRNWSSGTKLMAAVSTWGPCLTATLSGSESSGETRDAEEGVKNLSFGAGRPGSEGPFPDSDSELGDGPLAGSEPLLVLLFLSSLSETRSFQFGSFPPLAACQLYFSHLDSLEPEPSSSLSWPG